MSLPSNTDTHTLFPLFYVYKVYHVSFVSSHPTDEDPGLEQTCGICSKLVWFPNCFTIQGPATQKVFTCCERASIGHW